MDLLARFMQEIHENVGEIAKRNGFMVVCDVWLVSVIGWACHW